MSLNLSKIKEVAVLYGYASSGKTGILNRLCKDLVKTVGRANSCMEYYGNRHIDKLMRFLLPDGRILGVGTAGDSADLMLQNFIWFHECGSASLKDMGCDIVVLPVRILSQGRKFLSRYNKMDSQAKIVYEELQSLYGIKWKILTPAVGGVFRTNKICKRVANFKTLRRNDALRVLKELHSAVGF